MTKKKRILLEKIATEITEGIDHISIRYNRYPDIKLKKKEFVMNKIIEWYNREEGEHDE